MARPGQGRRVLVGRGPAEAGAIRRRLEAAGLETVCLPLIVTRPVAESATLDVTLRRLDRYDWIVFASANAVRYLLGRLRSLGIAPATGRRPRVCAGPATARVLAREGWSTDVVVEPFTAERAAAILASTLGPGERVLLPRAEGGRDVLGATLRAAGAVVDEVVLYRTEPERQLAVEAVRRLADGEFLALVLFSPSAVEALRRAGQSELSVSERERFLSGVTIACIGPTTAAAAGEAGWRVDVVPPTTTADALASALASSLATRLAGSRPETRR